MKPFQFFDVFAVNSHLHAETRHIAGLGDLVIIDDLYREPERIRALLDDSAIPPFKTGPKSRNFRDYFDCRLSIPAYAEQYDPRDLLGQMALGQIIRANFGRPIVAKRYEFGFNCFQWIHPPAPNYQFFPHVDGKDMIIAIIFLSPDGDAGGGTAFYRGVPDQDLGYSERDDVKIDIDAHCDLIDVVPGRFNRCILFPGWFPHAAYIGDHAFYTGDTWRLNQVYFFDLA